jgi:hypothetical protein
MRKFSLLVVGLSCTVSGWRVNPATARFQDKPAYSAAEDPKSGLAAFKALGALGRHPTAAAASSKQRLGPELPVKEPTRVARASPQMKDAPEFFSEYVQSNPSFFAKRGPLVRKGMTRVVAPLAAGSGYLFSPVSTQPLAAASGVALGTLSLLIRNLLAGQVREASGTAVAELLQHGLDSVTVDDIEEVGARFNVEGTKFDEKLSALFIAYVEACLETPTVARGGFRRFEAQRPLQALRHEHGRPHHEHCPEFKIQVP